MRMLLCGLLGMCLPAQVAVPTWVDAGPMLGHVDHASARVWVRVEKGVELVARASVELPGGTLRAVGGEVESRGDRLRLVRFHGLPADAKLTMQLARDPAFQRGVALVTRTAPVPSTTGTVRIALGAGPGTRALAGVMTEPPDLFVFVGTTAVYRSSDVDKTKRMLTRQMDARRQRALQPLLRSVPTYAVWRGHDFTPGSRKKARRVFAQMWANPGFGTAAVKGVFCAVRRGPVELFLLDTQYERKRSGGLGDQQLNWLIQGLRQSAARVKLVVAADLPDTERQRLDGAVAVHRVEGVFVLEADDVPSLDDGFVQIRVRAPKQGAVTIHVETRDARNRVLSQRNHRLPPL